MDILKVKFKIIQAEWSKNPDLIFNQCFQSCPGSSSLGEFQHKFLFKTSMGYLHQTFLFHEILRLRSSSAWFHRGYATHDQAKISAGSGLNMVTPMFLAPKKAF